MTAADQIPAVDAAVAKMDRRIDKAYGTIMRLEHDVGRLLKRIERVRRYAKELGAVRSRIATFELNL